MSRLICLITLLTLASFATAAEQKPNVIVILADDLGVSDLGCYGNTFHETPHLDRLAKDGQRIINAYSACTVCSPTRAALMTGQYPARLHITDWIAGHKQPFAKLSVPDWTMHLKPDIVTMPLVFKNAGYATASVGKWHLGGPDFYPEKHGFDINIAGTDKGQPPSYFSPYRIPTLKDGPDGEYVTDRLTVEACRWIEANREKPFFLYMPHFAVHTPLQAKKEVIAKYQAKAMKQGVKKNATYAALLEGLDDSIGAIRKTLSDLKIADKTIIVFTSDNGGLIGNEKNPITSNPPYRAGKGSAYEGGVRVPLILSVPSLGKSGDRNDLTMMTIDLFPTLAGLCQVPIPRDATIDGRNCRNELAGFNFDRPTEYYWHYPHYHPGGATPYSAIRLGNHRLIEFFEDGRRELYDLAADVAEKKDLAAANPDLAATLHDRLDRWRRDVGAQLPTKNPNYDPAKKK